MKGPVVVKRGDSVEPWDGSRDYRLGSRCSNRGKTWQCNSEFGVYNPSIEPSISGYYWVEVKHEDAR